ncbi:hypothetical protein ACFXPA_13190 [Amycolatopsis sp. NPDC059090]|uniref:hypothetical protein n=1 Tax=unclassified Amycolatopsis TaxID=2618356 RepID=UPI00366ACF20
MGFTAKKTVKMAMIGGAIAATALLSACSGNTAGNGSPVNNAAVQQSAPGAATGGSGGSSKATGKGGNVSEENGDVNCSKLDGKRVTPPGGPQMDVIAVSATTGTNPGCNDAFKVITEYYQEIPTKGEGPGHRVLDIFGHWTCAGSGDQANPQGSICGKDGRTDYTIETRPSSGGKGTAPQPRRFPNTTQTVQFTGYDASVNMATFQLVRPQGHGEYVPVAGDTKTYRLPLAERAIVWSAATLCQNDNQATVGEDGLGTFRCDADQLRRTLAGGTPALAQILVSGDDQIAQVKEIYHP